MHVSTLRALLSTLLVYFSCAFAPDTRTVTLIHLRTTTPGIGGGTWIKTRTGISPANRPDGHSMPSISTSHHHTQKSSLILHALPTKGIELYELLYDSSSTALSAWDWTSNLGAPAALVAATVLVLLSESREDMIHQSTDTKWTRRLKNSCRFLLLSSFAHEMASIFVGMVMGTFLLGHGEQVSKMAMVGYTSPLALFHHHHEFDYLVIQLGFLGGLVQFLAAVMLELLIKKDNETKSAHRMNRCLASWLGTLIIWITAFFNTHLNFYPNVLSMMRRFFILLPKIYITCWPPRPMSFLYVPSLVTTGVLTWRAFTCTLDQDEK